MERLDKLIVDMGIISSRARSKKMIEEGKVSVDGVVVCDPSQKVSRSARLILLSPEIPWVSRAALKLEHALTYWGINAFGKSCIDVGSSTGGFTEVLLSRGAKEVYAVDVGKLQLSAKLRTDSRVRLYESTDIRSFQLPPKASLVDIAVVDVSFISLLLVLPSVYKLLAPGGLLVALIKPQFEVGKGNTQKGIVRDEILREASKEKVIKGAEAFGFTVEETILSPIEGTDGNIEYLLCARK